uniref:CUB domain-containing protein n=1 Tax=Strigamia maritima TaxID=126957 RepID=T1JK72_STRMM
MHFHFVVFLIISCNCYDIYVDEFYRDRDSVNILSVDTYTSYNLFLTSVPEHGLNCTIEIHSPTPKMSFYTVSVNLPRKGKDCLMFVMFSSIANHYFGLPGKSTDEQCEANENIVTMISPFAIVTIGTKCSPIECNYNGTEFGFDIVVESHQLIPSDKCEVAITPASSKNEEIDQDVTNMCEQNNKSEITVMNSSSYLFFFTLPENGLNCTIEFLFLSSAPKLNFHFASINLPLDKESGECLVYVRISDYDNYLLRIKGDSTNELCVADYLPANGTITYDSSRCSTLFSEPWEERKERKERKEDSTASLSLCERDLTISIENLIECTRSLAQLRQENTLSIIIAVIVSISVIIISGIFTFSYFKKRQESERFQMNRLN